MAMHRVTPPGVCVLARLDRLLLAPKPPDDGVDGVERELVGRPRAAVDPWQETQHGAAPPAARGAHAARARAKGEAVLRQVHLVPPPGGDPEHVARREHNLITRDVR